MILTDLAHMKRFAGLSDGIAEGISYLDAHAAILTLGRHPIDGDRVYVNVMEYDTAPKPEPVFEAHRKYLDIQCILEGDERMEFAPLADVTETKAYDEAADCALYAGKGAASFAAPAGTIAIFFPEDAHAPSLMADAPSHVRKAVVKVAVEG